MISTIEQISGTVVRPKRMDDAHAIDQLLQTRAESILRESPYLSGQNLTAESHLGHLTLTGQVQTYFQKQMAQEALRGVEGLATIDNQLVVTW